MSLHTTCSRDWSSVVCSSDLSALPLRLRSKVPSWVIGVVSVLPVSVRLANASVPAVGLVLSTLTSMTLLVERSEERRVGKEWRVQLASESEQWLGGVGVEAAA